MSMEHGLTSYRNARHKPSYQGWTRQPSKRKKVPSPGKRVRDIHSQCQGTHKNIKLHNHNIYAEETVPEVSSSLISSCNTEL